MKQSKISLIGELLLRTKNGKRVAVQVYQGEGIFVMKRRMDDGTLDERRNVDVYRGSIEGYVSEATLKWHDLEREGFEWKPNW